MGDFRGLLGQVQEDDWLDRREGSQGQVEGMLHEAAQHVPDPDARSRGLRDPVTRQLPQGHAQEVAQGCLPEHAPTGGGVITGLRSF